MTTNLTELEIRLLTAYCNNDIVNDYGADDPYACGWVSSITSDAKMGIEARGVWSSLVKKGIIKTNGESCELTDFGRSIISLYKLNS